jgi:alpha-tubulin suppressor-like RCC1 family protein
VRASTTLAPVFAAIAAGLLLGACGGGLYDAKGVPALQGGGDVCGANQISCGGVCATPNPTQCGAGCADCTATVTPPPNGVVACLGDGASSTCGYACTDVSGVSQGFLKCEAGCCGTTALAAGDRTTCALLDQGGEVACWGANGSGQVGTGATSAAVAAPHLVQLGGSATAVAIAVGAAHACAVLSTGAVVCWGANDAGQVTGSAGLVPELAPIATPVGAGAESVAAGAGHTCARLSGGAVTCWGTGAAAQVGNPISSGATALVAGRDHACALVASEVRCWGSNAKGQLGVASASGIASPIPSGIQSLAAGGDHTCAATGTSRVTTPDDALRCWGDSVGADWLLDDLQLTPAIPLKEPGRATIEYDLSMIAAGARFVCVMKTPDKVQCLGENNGGQLGGVVAPGEAADPLPAITLPIATALAAGGSHACAALGDKSLRCWGANDAGQLGDGKSGPGANPGVGVLATPLGR